MSFMEMGMSVAISRRWRVSQPTDRSPRAKAKSLLTTK